jgi:guanine deaminase
MKGLASLQQETGAWAQTHISENKNEIELVKDMFPQSKHYTDVYDQAGLLTDKMILAHAVHLSDEEKKIIKQRNTKISHCPASNTALTSGCCKVRDFMDRGIDVGLGTDVSGGYSPSILDMVRHSILVSRHIAMAEGDSFKLSTEEALYLATRGGAKVVGLEKKVGGFEVGMEFDAQMIGFDVESKGNDETEESDEELAAFAEKDGPVDIFGWESWENRVNKWVYNGDDRNTLAVWVKGRLVHSRKEFKA